MVDRAQANEKIRWALNTEVVDIHGEPSVDGLRLRDTVTGAERDLAVGGLFIAIGHDPRSELVAGQVDIDAEGYISGQPEPRHGLDQHEPRRRLRRRRCRRPHLPAGDHRRRHRLRRGAWTPSTSWPPAAISAAAGSSAQSQLSGSAVLTASGNAGPVRLG